MRKFKNLVIGGIEQKFLNLVLISMLLVAGVFLAAMLTQNAYLVNLTNETSEKQIASMTGTTSEVVDALVSDNIRNVTGLQAKVTDRMFYDRSAGIRMVAETAARLLTSPNSVAPAAWQRPDISRDGELSVMVVLPDGVEEADVAKELGVLANLTETMTSLGTAYGADNVWFSTPNGVTLMADTRAADWINDDGSYVTYNAPNRYWYRQAVKAGKQVFSDVEFDFSSGKMCVTCAEPVYGPDGTLLGVAGADIFLDDMQEAVRNASENGAFLGIVNGEGHLILAPSDQLQVESSADADDQRNSEYPELAAFMADALKGETDVRLVHAYGDAYYMAAVPLETVGWTMITAYSQSKAEEPVRQLEADFQKIEEDAAAAYRSRSDKGKILAWIVLILLLAAMLFGAIKLGKRIVRPLNTITQRIQELSEDNLEFKMEDTFRTGDEVEALAESFASISHRTVEYLDTVQRVTAEKERIGAELSLATQIQSAMLPHIVPAFPDRNDFDVVGTMDAAKEVGGDFYDYFLIDDDHLCLVIADVSGKGVPAALFMMASRIILQSTAKNGGSPSEILTRANQAICSDNETEMFVTVWIGTLELSTGKLTCSNAGHEYPVFRAPGGQFELFRDRHGFVIGGMEDSKYKEYEVQLEPGSRIFVYTDGVPEATNAAEELFGTDRMIEALNRNPDAEPMIILKNVREAVDDFVQNAEQFDDLTMLCLEYRGPDAPEKA